MCRLFRNRQSSDRQAGRERERDRDLPVVAFEEMLSTNSTPVLDAESRIADMLTTVVVGAGLNTYPYIQSRKRIGGWGRGETMVLL